MEANESPDLMKALEDSLRPPTYVVDLTIDQRPTRREVVSWQAYTKMVGLGWFKDGRAVLVERR